MSTTNILLLYGGSSKMLQQFQADGYQAVTDDSGFTWIEGDGFPKVVDREVNPTDASDLIINAELLVCFANCMSAAAPSFKIAHASGLSYHTDIAFRVYHIPESDYHNDLAFPAS